MLDCHKQDIEGCNYIMNVVSSYFPDVEWTHTEGEYDRYDMDWVITTTAGKSVECKAEGKDRRKNKKGEDIRTRSYPTAFLNSAKFRYLVTNFKNPYALMGYSDGVIVYNLKQLPFREVIEDIVEASLAFGDESYTWENEVKINEWTKWKYVWNPARKRKNWELNVELPIPEVGEKIKGVTVLYDVRK